MKATNESMPFAFMHDVYESIDAAMKAARQDGEAVPGTYADMYATTGICFSSISDMKKGVTCA